MEKKKVTTTTTVVTETIDDNKNYNLTEIVFILDGSGSMSDLKHDTIGGYNSFIEEQKKAFGEAYLTTVVFDDKYEIVHDRVNLKDVKPITDKEYFTRGMTALLDAIGKTISTVENRIATAEEKPGNVIFVITTDGEENHSKEYAIDKIREMISKQTNENKWQFIFLGANIDAVSAASSFGINPDFARTYTASCAGTQSVYSAVSKGIFGARGDAGARGPVGATFDSTVLDEVE